MSLLNLISERYDREARLYPALLLISPAVATGVALFSNKLIGLQSLGATVVGFGGAFLLTQLARDAGKSREPSLYKLWGGIPSVLIFRHSHERFDSITKARYHKKLATLVSGAQAPSNEDEQEDPAAADQVYSAWSQYLRANTRDTTKYPLLFQENVSYGYRRNVWGLRPIGISVSLLCSLIAGWRLLFIHEATGEIDQGLAGALTVSFLFLALWLFRFTSDWVRVPANAYAERLAESLETIGGNAPVEQEKP
ncbi:hypothetical protein [Synechococcus sp. 1G10]|uniref:hypothetical protein n=1 Tax=Synechococcus sp. 1G10 TaxID=2025605 RepID=UPI00118048AB|nr:hypothetical protein [Synechococcus sp. 1G10]